MRLPEFYFFTAKLDPSVRQPKSPCIVPRDAVERMVVSCERSERGADAGTARKTSIAPRDAVERMVVFIFQRAKL